MAIKYLVDTVCVICGKQIKRRRDHVEKYQSSTCGAKCRSQVIAQANSGQNNANYKGLVNVECSNCGEQMKRYPCHANTFKNFFCNAKCQGEWRSKTGATRGTNNARWKGGLVVVICAVCGQELQREKNQLKRNTHHFCDHTCYGKWLSENYTGENSPSWKGGWESYYGPNWDKQRSKARRRDGHRCQHCGIIEKKLGKAMDVHHIKPFREFHYIPGQNENYRQANDLQNLISLCPICHKQAEHAKIPIQPKLI